MQIGPTEAEPCLFTKKTDRLFTNVTQELDHVHNENMNKKNETTMKM